MDFGFSDEQDLLRGQARDLLDRDSPPGRVRELIAAGAGHDRGLYARVAGLGWPGIPFPEAYGGHGLGLVDLGLVLEEMGRHLTPSPLLASVGMAGMTVLAAGTEEQRARLLPRICDGSALATLAHLETGGRWDPGTSTVRARRSGDAYLLDGTKQHVPDADVANWMIVAAGEDGGVSLLVVDPRTPGVTITPTPLMDPTRTAFEVRFDGVEVPADSLVGRPGEGAAALERGLDRALVAISAELCGTAQRAMELAVDYAKTRVQFGRPIGAFQAVSHRCADMLVRVEQTRSLVYHAAWALDTGDPGAPLAAAMAKAYAGDTAQAVASGAIQVHGGIGFTWEHDVHLYFRRAMWGATVLGDAVHHRERVAGLLSL